ncbi:TPA: fimbrial protein [Raoultella planticola]|uniref:fimbrial protein n=1 Tax=Raoultella planticola TaxID=575 RepID=UPI001A309A5F|nr:fimbrial protein [Raoultella planticola]
MKKIIVLLAAVFFSSGIAAAPRLCTYTDAAGNDGGLEERQGMSLDPKISADPSLPVGAILYSKTIGGMNLHFRLYSCEPGAEYVVEVNTAQVPGVTLRGMPVYETGIPGVGIQFSDIFTSRVGKQVPGEAGSWPTPYDKSSQFSAVPYFSVWLVKTGPIDTSATHFNVEIKFSVRDPAYPTYERGGAIYWVNPKTSNVTFRNESCNISVKGPSTVNLQRITKSELLALSRGATTGKGKTIDMNISCPTDLQGRKLTYWFNPKSSVATDVGVMENAIPAAGGGANNVGIILKKDSTPVKFYDTDAYNIMGLRLDQDISFTADYFKINDDISDGLVKAVIEVVIQED